MTVLSGGETWLVWIGLNTKTEKVTGSQDDGFVGKSAAFAMGGTS
jgi:hypothetical protein